MFYRIIFVLIILILIIMVFFVKIKIVIEYRKGGQNDHFEVAFFVLKKRFGYKKNRSTEEKDGILTDYKKLIKNIEKSRNFYQKNKEIIMKILNYIKCRIYVERLEFKAVIGTGDASSAAILAGVAWSLAGILFSILPSFTNVKNKKVEIRPDFTGKKFNVELYCIFKVKIVYIIVIGLMILKHLIKAKVGFTNVKRSIAVYK